MLILTTSYNKCIHITIITQSKMFHDYYYITFNFLCVKSTDSLNTNFINLLRFEFNSSPIKILKQLWCSKKDGKILLLII